MARSELSKKVARYNRIVSRLIKENPELFGIILPKTVREIKKRKSYGKSTVEVPRTTREIMIEVRNLERSFKKGGTDLVRYGSLLVPRFVKENFKAAERRAITKARKEGLNMQKSRPPESRKEFLQKLVSRENYGDTARLRLKNEIYKQNYIKSLRAEYPNAEELIKLAQNFTGEELFTFSETDPRFKIRYNYNITEKNLQGELLAELLRGKLKEKRRKEATERKSRRRIKR